MTETRSEHALLCELADAAADLDKIAAALIRTGDMRIVATDIGAAAIAERATRLTKAVSALKRFRGER